MFKILLASLLGIFPIVAIAFITYASDATYDAYAEAEASPIAEFVQSSPLQGVLANPSEDFGLSAETTIAAPAATGEYIGIAPTVAAVAELTKILRTPADEPTPNLTFRFNAVRHSFNGDTGAVGQVPQLGTVIDGVGTFDLNINATNGSPSTAGGITTLTRAINILEGIDFGLPLPVGVYVWHVYEVAESSGVNALDGRSAVQYSPAIYALTVSVTGTTAPTRAVAITFAAIEQDLFAPVGAPMYAWGLNATGQLGTGDQTRREVPTRIGTAENWVALSSAANASAAINAEGHLYVWGNNRNHVGMGRGGTAIDAPAAAPRILTPERLFMPNENPADPDTWHSWAMIDVAGSTPGVRMLALTDDGQLWAWGINRAGQLGIGTTGIGSSTGTPQRVRADLEWKTVSTVSFSPGFDASVQCFTLAITTDGHMYSWGNNRNSQLGRGGGQTGVPARVNPSNTGNTEWRRARAAGDGTAFAICMDGNLYSWGNNSGDQLGRPGGTTATPTRNLLTFPATADPVNEWVDVTQQVNTPQTTMALTDDGRIFTWNPGTATTATATRGLGRPANAANPTNRASQVGTASDWVYIGSGNAHGLAINSAGRLYTWGLNDEGQLGLGATGNTGAMPAENAAPRFALQTFGLEGISQTGSGSHSMALIRTDPMTFTNIYSVQHPNPITVQGANFTKNLRELTRTPQQTGSSLSFDFAIQRYSFNGNTGASYVANLPALGITPFVGGTYTLNLPMNQGIVNATHAGGVTTLARTVNVLADIQFSNPGVYVWRISEVSGSSGVTAPAHMAYSPAVYYLTVTITETGTGPGNTTLTGAVTVTVGTADVPPAAANTMTFTNTHTTTSTLNVSKAVSGGSMPAGQQFPFTVAITGSVLCPANASFTARVYTAATGGGASTFVRDEVFESGDPRTINIEGGQYFVFNTIAEGATFNVTEAVPASWSGSVAIVVGGTTVTPAVPDVAVGDTNRNLSTGNRIIGAGTNSAAFANVHHWEIPTGLTVGTDGTWIIIAIAVATVLGASVATKTALQGAAPVAASTAFIGQSAQYVSNAGKTAFRRAESFILKGLGR